MDEIDKKCETVATKKGKATVLVSHHLFEKALNLILVERSEEKRTQIQNILFSSGNYPVFYILHFQVESINFCKQGYRHRYSSLSRVYRNKPAIWP